MYLDRKILKSLVKERIIESRTLLKEGCYSGAYYICGYAIEYALKSCFAKNIKKCEFPDLNALKQIYTHTPKDLVKASGLGIEIDKQIKKDRIFAVYWQVVSSWSEESRYQIHNPKKAQDLYKAVNNSKHGVLKWIKKYW